MKSVGSGSPADAPTAGSVVIQAMREGCERAFTSLLEHHYPRMLRLASMYIPERAGAEKVVREVWLAALGEIDQFDDERSLRAWVSRTMVDRARRQAQEARNEPPESPTLATERPARLSVSPNRFLPADHPQYPHHWAHPPASWGQRAEERLRTPEARARITAAIQALPPSEREVITLRDIEGWTPHEVCDALRLHEADQQALLHRARSRVRRSLEEYFVPAAETLLTAT